MHQRDANKTFKAHKLALVLLGLSAASSILRDGLALGILVWPLALSISAALITVILAYRPSLISRLGKILQSTDPHTA